MSLSGNVLAWVKSLFITARRAEIGAVMQALSPFFYILGLILVGIGVLSALALFGISISGSEKYQKSSNNLWGLFIVGIISGIIFVILARVK